MSNDEPQHHYRRRHEQKLEGTPAGTLYHAILDAFLARPKMFMSAVITVFVGAGGAVGTGVGATVLPYVQQLEFDGHMAHYQAHVSSSDRAYKELLRDNCEMSKKADTRSLRSEIRAIKSEIWELEGLGEERTARDTARLIELRSDLDELQEELEDRKDEDCTNVNTGISLRPPPVNG